MEDLVYYRAEINNRLIGFHNKTEFKVQENKKGSAYKTKYSVKGGKLENAMQEYDDLKLKKGHNKRLIMLGSNGIVLLKRDSK